MTASELAVGAAQQQQETGLEGEGRVPGAAMCRYLAEERPRRRWQEATVMCPVGRPASQLSPPSRDLAPLSPPSAASP